MDEPNTKQWFDGLSEEDYGFIKRFILASGSLKELAEIYGISYPTVRLRLDRLIQKIRILDEQREMGEFESLIRLRYTEGKFDLKTMKEILDLYRKETGGKS